MGATPHSPWVLDTAAASPATPLVSPSATGPHRVPMASVMPMLMPSVLVPVDSSVSPAPTLLSASTTMAMVPSPIPLASALLMPMDTDTPVLDTDTDAESPDITVAVSPSATGLPRALASATLMLMPMVTATATLPSALSAVPASTPLVSPSATGLPRALASVMLMLTPTVTPQSWPRATQAGPELLPQDSSPPATDADWARGLLTPSPPSATATGPHRELTVWDSTAVDTTGVKQYVKYENLHPD